MVDEDERPTEAIAAQAPPADEEDTARASRDARLGPGTDVGGYVIDGEIGRGGMGFVYSATHPVIGKRAAIKVLKPEVSTSPIVVERFIQEARAVNRIGHPNIVDIFAFGQLPDGRAYHIMDLLVGESLRRRLRRGPLHPSEAASVLDEIASALIAAHDKGFVHRDLKPDNVFLVEHEGRWPEVKLLDFGLAKLMPEAGVAPFQTKIGVMLGTPEYMSPEQARGQGVDYRTDIYALGVLTFEILAGARPFPSLGDSYATLQAHATQPPPSIADRVPGLPVELVQLVTAMLAKDPAARPSLAAVRTVVRRLRTTQLPTRTAAGLEILPRPARTAAPKLDPAQPLEAVGPSKLGAEPVVPAEPRPTASQPQPALSPQPAGSSQPLPPQPAPTSSPPPTSTMPPSTSTHGRGTGSAGALARASAPTTPPGSQIPSTVLGVGVPASVRRPTAPSRTTASPASSRIWLILGALLAIAAGVALAIAFVG